MTKKRVLVIGLDSATFDLILPWIDEGKLPNMAKLIKNGAYGVLKSTLPPFTLPAWPSFMTGKNPGKHGIFGFVEKDEDNRVHISSRPKKFDTIWSILSRHNKKVGVVNVPFTYPPEKVNGFLISGMLTPPNKTFTHPSDLYSELKEKIGDYKIDVEELYAAGNEEKYIKDLYYTTKKRGEAIKYLMKEYGWEFFLAVFWYTDQVQHFFWKYMDENHPLYSEKKATKYRNVILDYYQEIDKIIGDMLRLIDDETYVIIMSDHGAAPLHKILLVNQWLMEKGLFESKKSPELKSTSIKFRVKKLVFNKSRLKKILIILKISKYRKKLPEKIRELFFQDFSSPPEVEWSKTKAYADANQGIRINLKGREKDGIVEPGEEYENLKQWLIEELLKLRDPDNNEKIVRDIYKKEDIYTGKYVKRFPDLIIVFNRNYGFSNGFGDKIVSQTSLWSGEHDENGMVIMNGPNIKKERIEGARIIDLAPTILHLMGVPVPDDMDGAILKNAFKNDFLDNGPINHKEKLVGDHGPE